MGSSSIGATFLSKYRIPWHSLTITCKTSILKLGFFSPMIQVLLSLNPFSWNICKVWNFAGFTFTLTSTHLSVNHSLKSSSSLCQRSGSLALGLSLQLIQPGCRLVPLSKQCGHAHIKILRGNKQNLPCKPVRIIIPLSVLLWPHTAGTYFPGVAWDAPWTHSFLDGGIVRWSSGLFSLVWLSLLSALTGYLKVWV